MHTASDPSLPATRPTLINNWMRDYTSTNTANVDYYISDPDCFNMFVRAWNERLRCLSIPEIIDDGFWGSPTIHRYRCAFRPAQLFPEARQNSYILFGRALDNPVTPGYAYFSGADLVSFAIAGATTIRYLNLSTDTLVVGLKVVIGLYTGHITAFDATTITVDVAPVNDALPTDKIKFYGLWQDTSVRQYGWFALISDVLAKAPYFVKNENADGTQPANFFLQSGISHPNSWAQAKDPTLITYGPDSLANLFTRLFPREISIQDTQTSNPDGTLSYTAHFNQTTRRLSGTIVYNVALQYIYTTPPVWAIPTVGALARLTAGGFYGIHPNNPDFKYYVKGRIFRFDETGNWVESADQTLLPDIMSTTGAPLEGDYMTPKLLNQLRDAINRCTWTLVTILSQMERRRTPTYKGTGSVATLTPAGSTTIDLYSVTGTFEKHDYLQVPYGYGFIESNIVSVLPLTGGTRINMSQPLQADLYPAVQVNGIQGYCNVISTTQSSKYTISITSQDSTITGQQSAFQNGRFLGDIVSSSSSKIVFSQYNDEWPAATYTILITDTHPYLESVFWYFNETNGTTSTWPTYYYGPWPLFSQTLSSNPIYPVNYVTGGFDWTYQILGFPHTADNVTRTYDFYPIQSNGRVTAGPPAKYNIRGVKSQTITSTTPQSIFQFPYINNGSGNYSQTQGWFDAGLYLNVANVSFTNVSYLLPPNVGDPDNTGGFLGYSDFLSYYNLSGVQQAWGFIICRWNFNYTKARTVNEGLYG